MLSFIMYVFLFLVVIVILGVVLFGMFISKAVKKPEDPNVIDVQAMDVDEDQAAEITATDQLLKP